MTRSFGTSPLKIAKKELRAKAKYEMVSFKSVLQARETAEKSHSPAGTMRRNPGRMDGTVWNGRNFICVQKVDGPYQDNSDDDYEGDSYDAADYENTQFQRNQLPQTISLLDIARPAKRKGVAKEFEIVDGVRRIIALDDEDYPGDTFNKWEDEWEIYDKREFEECKLYSDVLKGDSDRC